MNLKKIILFVLLVFAITSLFIIAIFAKSRRGPFGKSYDAYIKKQTQEISEVIDKNIKDTSLQVEMLASSELTKSLFVSYALGEEIARFENQYSKYKTDMSNCQKIQIVDIEGKIVFSTIKEEVYSQKVKKSMLHKFKGHFSTRDKTLAHFIDSKIFVMVFPAYINKQGNNYQGFILAYYDTQEILNGVKNKRISIPFSVDNFIFLSSKKSINDNDISQLIYYYQTNKNGSPTDGESKTIGAIAKVHGLNIINFHKDDKYIPPLALAFILVNLALLGLVAFVLIQVLREEQQKQMTTIPKSMYVGESSSRYEDEFEFDTLQDNKRFNVPNQDEIQELVEDIETDENYTEGVASNGIEEMIMSDDSNLMAEMATETPTEIALDDEPMKFDDIPSTEAPAEMALDDEFDIPSTEAPTEMALDDSPIEISQETEMFAEQERILDENNLSTEDTTFDALDDDISTEQIDNAPVAEKITLGDISDKFETMPKIDSEETSIELETENIDEEIQDIETEIVQVGSETIDKTPIIEGIQLVDEDKAIEELKLPENEDELMNIEDIAPTSEESELDFDIDSAINEVPSVEDGGYDDGDISLDEKELAAIDLDFENEELSSETLETADAIPDISTNEIVTGDIDFDIDSAINEVPSVEDGGYDDGDISLDTNELAAIDLDLEDNPLGEEPGEPVNLEENPLGEEPGEPVNLEENPLGEEPGEIIVTDISDISVEGQIPEPTEKINFNKVFSEPPIRLSSIDNVEAYSTVANDIAKNNLNISKVAIMKKGEDGFKAVISNDFANPIEFGKDDPVLEKFLMRKKSLDIRGNLKSAKYLTDKFTDEELEKLEEIIIVPIVKEDSIEGIAIYAREKGVKEPTNLQKSELHNLGFLQNV